MAIYHRKMAAVAGFRVWMPGYYDCKNVDKRHFFNY